MRTLQSELERLGLKKEKKKAIGATGKPMSTREIEDLMGIGRQTYRRHRGKLRQR